MKYEGRHRLSVAHLLTALTAMFVIMPFVDRVPYGNLVESVVFTVVLLASVNAVGGQRRTLIAAAMLVAPAILARWLTHLWPGLLPYELSLLAAIVFVALVILHLLRFVLFAPVVNAEVLCAALSIYLLFAVAWAFAYTMLARWEPAAFVFTDATDAKATLDGFTALYFSVQILTTITFGDIMPVSNVARMMAIVEAAAGVFYMAILVARLVGLYASKPPSGDAGV